MDKRSWKEDGLEGLGCGSKVWVASDDRRSWRAGTLCSTDSAPYRIMIHGERDQPTVETAVEPHRVVPANPPTLEAHDDLTQLSFLNEPSILHALRQRHGTDAIYTRAGPILVAVNPFKPVSRLYGADAVDCYQRPQRGDAAATPPPPHIFQVADLAYRAMMEAGRPQSVLITGESGAGKTETTKLAMRYLAQLAGGSGMEDRVLQTTPLLEAFGNARTALNDNSSRFVRLVDVQFTRAGAICGAAVSTCLLEKGRVARQPLGERSFHVLYQLCRGASEEERRTLRLPPDPAFFACLRRGECTEVSRIDDAEAFVGVRQAAASVGVDPNDFSSVCRVLAAVLWLGNIRFASVPGDDDTAAVSTDAESVEALDVAAELLGCEAADLAAALTRRKMQAGGELVHRHLGVEGAAEARDALAKALYEALFGWLVAQVRDCAGGETLFLCFSISAA
jgi:myosin V